MDKRFTIIRLTRIHPIYFYFPLSYLITWPGWWLEVNGHQIGAFLGYFGPAIAACILLARYSGKAGIEGWLTRIFRWRVSLKWYIAAFGIPLGSVLLVIFLQTIVEGNFQEVNPSQWQTAFPALWKALVIGTLFGIFVASGEELGWRGYAYPGLLTRVNALTASVIIGIFWALWHLPINYLYGLEYPEWIDIILYGVGTITASVIYAWIFNHTQGSVLLSSIFHSTYDVGIITIGRMAMAASGVNFSFRIHMLVLLTISIVIFLRSGPNLGNLVTTTDDEGS